MTAVNFHSERNVLFFMFKEEREVRESLDKIMRNRAMGYVWRQVFVKNPTGTKL